MEIGSAIVSMKTDDFYPRLSLWRVLNFIQKISENGNCCDVTLCFCRAAQFELLSVLIYTGRSFELRVSILRRQNFCFGDFLSWVKWG